MEEGKEKNKIDKTLLLLTCTARYLTLSLSLSRGVSVVSCTCLFFFFFSFLSVCLADVFLIRLFGRRLDINQTLPKYGHRLDNKLENPEQSISQRMKTVQRHALSTPSSFVFGNQWLLSTSSLLRRRWPPTKSSSSSSSLLPSYYLCGALQTEMGKFRWGLNGIF